MNTDILVSVLAVVSPVASIIFAWLTFGRNRKQDAQDAAGSLAMMQSDIGYIKAGNDDIKRQLEAQEKNMDEVRERLTRVEVSAERAHNRLNRLEKHEDNACR